MASLVPFVLFTVILAGSSAVASTHSSSVSVAGFSCPVQIPGCAAKRCTTRFINNKQTHVCLRCQSGYTPVKDGRSIVQCVSTSYTSSKLSGFSCPTQIPGCATNRCTTRTINHQQTHVCLRCQAGYKPVKNGKSIVQCIPSSNNKPLSGISCPAQIPGCAAKRCTARLINNQQTHVCLRCQAGYVAVKDGKSITQCVPAPTFVSVKPKALSGISCPAEIAGCAAKRCTIRTINNKQTHVCLRCQAGYVAVKDGKSIVQCVPAAATNATIVASNSSVVKPLSGISCPAQIPGCAAKRCTTRMINNKQALVCLRCEAGYVPVTVGKSIVQCAQQSAAQVLPSNTSSNTSAQQTQPFVQQQHSSTTLGLVLSAMASL